MHKRDKFNIICHLHEPLHSLPVHYHLFSGNVPLEPTENIWRTQGSVTGDIPKKTRMPLSLEKSSEISEESDIAHDVESTVDRDVKIVQRNHV